MSSNTPTIRQELKSLRTIYGALIVGVVLFALIAIALTLKGGVKQEDPGFAQILLIVATLTALVNIPMGLSLFKRRTATISDEPLKNKIEIYRSAMIIRTAILEGNGFFFIVCYILTGATVFLIELLAIIVLMIYFFPTSSRLSKEMQHDLREL
ncbi:hypothetical protein [Sunxiuqinia elliptica]|uniref:Uncharacterized protein n=1 Tax=Sunxiuqinia elliptica TaxID=655355 RepID=A0A4V6PRW9_9BACT|nr:hypothetical protein [Sunxiuqinia elliptica]TDO05029.1 hypothetical protein DET52_101385 [Sunxiuqinia elliptica]TDO64578.1 hypothetical protein DET65_0944 [Sunxiuqinia elliptica]